MKLSQLQWVLNVKTTPEELRQIADGLERAFATPSEDGTVPCCEIECPEGLLVLWHDPEPYESHVLDLTKGGKDAALGSGSVGDHTPEGVVPG